MKKEHKHKIRVVSWILFCIYLVIMVYFLFFCERLGRVPKDRYCYNLRPFTEIYRYIYYAHRVGSCYVLLNLAGNVICFMPFGFVIPVLINRYHKWYQIAAISFVASLSVETIQLFSKLGSFDVDDILLNTIGGMIGYILFRICKGILSLWNHPKKK